MPVRQKMKRTQGINIEQPHGRDLFQTPNYATELLLPYIPFGHRIIWECAAGSGKIANVLIREGYDVVQTDLIESKNVQIHNFLTAKTVPSQLIPWHPNDFVIITNPPFSLKKQFYDQCIHLDIPFALLLPTDYCGWIITALQKGAEKIIPTRRIDYITPSGLSGATGNSANFHSMWLTKGFGLGETETFVELTQEMKKNI